jgi:3-hydroxyisobutyrate dehydrogenase-like beta-hydroxyacid dehydrogenase
MAVSMLGVSEALALGQSLGISASTLTRVFNSSSARCWSRYLILIFYSTVSLLVTFDTLLRTDYNGMC